MIQLGVTWQDKCMEFTKRGRYFAESCACCGVSLRARFEITCWRHYRVEKVQLPVNPLVGVQHLQHSRSQKCCRARWRSVVFLRSHNLPQLRRRRPTSQSPHRLLPTSQPPSVICRRKRNNLQVIKSFSFPPKVDVYLHAVKYLITTQWTNNAKYCTMSLLSWRQQDYANVCISN